jgi:hypothetical protein
MICYTHANHLSSSKFGIEEKGSYKELKIFINNIQVHVFYMFLCFKNILFFLN